MRRAPWTKSELLLDAAKYNSRIEWKRESNSAWAAARKNGWLDEACGHMQVLRRKTLTKAEVLASATSHSTRGE